MLFCGLNTAEILAFFFGRAGASVDFASPAAFVSPAGFASVAAFASPASFVSAAGFTAGFAAPFTLERTSFCASSSILLLDVFTSYWVPFKESKTSCGFIFNSFASSYTLSFDLYNYLRYSVVNSFNCFMTALARPSLVTANDARNSFPI